MFISILVVSLIIIVLYLLAIMPKLFNRPDLSLFKDKYYAHRGLHQNNYDSPENSLASFQLAIESNFGIELDVQLSKDGIAVVFHDQNLKRVCGIDKNVKELTFHELSMLHLFHSNEKIPSFQQVLDLVDGQIPLIVEIKARDTDISVCSVISNILDNYKGLYCVESFNPLILLWYKKNRPNIVRGQLSSNYLKESLKKNKILELALQNLLYNFITKPNFISFNYRYHKSISFVLCRDLYKITTVAYSIPSQEDLDNNSPYFDLFIFENFIPN